MNTAVAGFVGALVGIAVTIGGGIFVLGGHFADWSDIRSAHKDGRVVNANIDTSQFALKTETIMFGQPVKLRTPDGGSANCTPSLRPEVNCLWASFDGALPWKLERP